MQKNDHRLAKLFNLRCILCSLLIISGCVFWASLINHYSVRETEPLGEWFFTTLLERHPVGVAVTAFVLVFVYVSIEVMLKSSKSKLRFSLMLLMALASPFLASLLYIEFSNSLVSEEDRDVGAIQKMRFGEYGEFLKGSERLTLYSLESKGVQKGDDIDNVFIVIIYIFTKIKVLNIIELV